MPNYGIICLKNTTDAMLEADTPKYLANVKTAKGRERTRLMLAHAIDTFIELGYEGASLNKIIAKAGGSRASLYQHFGNKEGLFNAALEMMADDLYRTCISKYRHGRTLKEDLTSFGEIFLTAMTDPRAVGALRLVYAQSANLPQVGNWFYENAVRSLYASFAKVLENHIDASLDELTPVAAIFVEALKGKLFHRALCLPSYRPTQDEIRLEVELCCDMLTAYLKTHFSNAIP